MRPDSLYENSLVLTINANDGDCAIILRGTGRNEMHAPLLLETMTEDSVGQDLLTTPSLRLTVPKAALVMALLSDSPAAAAARAILYDYIETDVKEEIEKFRVAATSQKTETLH